MTELTRWSPFEGTMTLRDAMNQLLADSFVRPNGSGFSGVPLDLYETEHGYVAELAVPGLTPENFEITLEQNVLTVHGKTEPRQQDGLRYHIQERRTGAFKRSIALPTLIDAEKIQANLSNGILTIQLPKAEAAKPKRISIQAA